MTMRTLIFLRHAKSSWALPGVDDFDRPLNERGNKAAPKMANWLISKSIKPDVIICSSAKRTSETLAHIQPAFDQSTATIMEPNLYLASSERLFESAAALDDTVQTAMLLGHNPGMHDAALSALTAANRRESGEMRSRFPTCACAIISLPINRWSEITTDIGELNAYMTPRGLKTP